MALGVLLLVTILIALLVDRIFFHSSSSPAGAGSGVAATQARSLPAFTGIDLAGDNNIIVQVGARQSIIVHADSNLLANNVGGNELALDPVNAWAATLILAAALDDFARSDNFKPGGGD